ncbi:MAG: hypothetical protein HFE04_02405 [Bacilli bacterium]|nr:hypothetical protein [Bacilli bacterium]
MEKRIINILTIIIISFALIMTNIPKLEAATGTMNVRTSKSSVVVGATFNVSVTISGNQPIGSWQYTIQYDSSKLKLVSGDVSVAETIKDDSTKSKTYNYTFKAIARGTSSISLAAYSLADFGENYMTVTSSGAKVTVITQAELEASYSKNNNLSSLSVKDYALSPEFNKDTLEYSVKVPSDVEKITLEGAVEDKKASITGLGEFDVSEGENKFEVTVTAENGSQKTYVVKVTVEDVNPIETVIDGITYTVVKRGSTLTAPSTFEATTQIINGIEVPAFKSSITNFVLVGLKSKEGTPKLYIYDEKDNSFTLYREIKTEGILIFPGKAKVVPDNYKKVKITINDEEVEAYEYSGTNNKGILKKLNAATSGNGFYLIYGTNIETGEEDFYQFDTKLNTLSRYNRELIDTLTKENKNYLLIIIVLSVETLVMILILLVSFVKKGKKKRRSKKDFANFDDFPEKNKEVKKEEPKEKSKENKPETKKEEK